MSASASSASTLAASAGESSALDPRTNPVINTPYEEPRHHWELDALGRALEGRPPQTGRRPSHGILPVPTVRKGEPVQEVLELHPEDLNETVEEIRVHLRRWRQSRWPGATHQTRKLLAYWTRDNRHIRPFFAQLEAVETVIWLTETRPGRRYAKTRIAPRSTEANEGVVRWAVKMATGTGKTMVMAMLIVWHTLNDVRRPARRGARHPYTSAFLAITPGHTVRERLGELSPSHPDNVYRKMDLVPPGFRPRLNRAQVAIVNFQAFQRRDLLSGVSGDGRKVLDPQGGAGVEDAAVMLDRVLRTLKGRNRLLVLNDEAHHCYNPSFGAGSKDDQKVAGVCFNALLDLHRQKRLLATYDFSATPMFISTTARKHGGELLPWVVSDFPLMEAIESGLVKIPRLPVDDDAEGFDVKWRALYRNAKPKKVTRHSLPGLLEDALTSLQADWWLEWERWRKAGRRTPPVFIVVANSISNARALYEYIGGYERTDPHSGRTEYVKGRTSGEFSNVRLDGTGWKETPVTLLMHSKLDSDDKVTGALAKLVKAQAARLSGARRRTGPTDDVSLLRNVLNTVGREGEPGEHIRCVISVSMLTEGWDTRTVTHVLGYRAFSTQLLCEQVTGRALRRADYESFDSAGRLIPEYSQVLGIPFDFMPTGRGDDLSPANPVYQVRTLADRSHLRLDLPRPVGYAWKPATGRLRLDPARVAPYDVTVIDRPTLVALEGVTGEPELVGIDEVRFRQAAWQLAAECSRRVIAEQEGAVYGKGWLFADLFRAVEEWLAHPDVACSDPRVLMQRPHFEEAVGLVLDACIGDEEKPKLVGVFDSDMPAVAGTSSVSFETTLSNRYPPADDSWRAAKKSEINIAACHSRLETVIAELLDTGFPPVEAWARNFRLGWDIPYLFDGVWHSYEPDFVARIRDRNGEPVHLIVECKGRPDEQSAAKARYVTDWWIPAVANSPQLPAGLRRWRFVEITAGETAGRVLGDAIGEIVRSGSADGTVKGRE